MKKSILVICAVLATFCLTAFSYMGWDSSPQAEIDLFYDVDSRYMTTVTMEDLNKAKSFFDIVPENPKRAIVSYSSVNVIILDDNYKTVISETGDSPELTAAQIKLLRSVDYSTDILIKADYQEKNRETGELEDGRTTPHITVVPEKQAVCTSGKDALIAYAKENTKEFAAIVKKDELQPGKVTFTVTKEGKVANASITATSGYPAFDMKMMSLVSSMPGTWEPATNSKGEKVAQKFVFSFGIIGC